MYFPPASLLPPRRLALNSPYRFLSATIDPEAAPKVTPEARHGVPQADPDKIGQRLLPAGPQALAPLPRAGTWYDVLVTIESVAGWLSYPPFQISWYLNRSFSSEANAAVRHCCGGAVTPSPGGGTCSRRLILPLPK